jgi:hypothetical protein
MGHVSLPLIWLYMDSMGHVSLPLIWLYMDSISVSTLLGNMTFGRCSIVGTDKGMTRRT